MPWGRSFVRRTLNERMPSNGARPCFRGATLILNVTLPAGTETGVDAHGIVLENDGDGAASSLLGSRGGPRRTSSIASR